MLQGEVSRGPLRMREEDADANFPQWSAVCERKWAVGTATFRGQVARCSELVCLHCVVSATTSALIARPIPCLSRPELRRRALPSPTQFVLIRCPRSMPATVINQWAGGMDSSSHGTACKHGVAMLLASSRARDTRAHREASSSISQPCYAGCVRSSGARPVWERKRR